MIYVGGRRWTQEELRYLDEHRAYKTAAQIAKRLGRSVSSVSNAMHRYSLCSYRGATDWLSLYEIYQIIGISPETLKRKWQTKGLTITRVGKYNMVDQGDLIRYMKAHPEDWNANLMKSVTIFASAPWLEEMKGYHKSISYHWSEQDVETLQEMYTTGCEIKAIAERLGRSKGAVKQKLQRLRDKGWIV